MKLQDLREFVLLARCKSYTTVAEQFFISQPSITRHIKDMEDELGGVELFSRSTRKVELTDYGLYFLPYAMKMVAMEDEFKTGISHMQDIRNRTLTIGVINQTSFSVSDLISEFNVKYPDIHFELISGESEDLRKRLVNGELDFAFIREPQTDIPDRFGRIALSSSPLKVIFRRDHHLADRKEIRLQDIRDEIFLLSEENSLATKLVRTAEAAENTELTVLFQGQKSQIINLVHHGTGISLLLIDDSDLIYEDLRTAILIPDRTANINLLYIPERIKAPKQNDFISFARQYKASASSV